MWAHLVTWQQAWLAGLLAVWAALLFGGFIGGRSDAQQARRMPVWTRMLSSAALVVAGWSWYLFSRDLPAAPLSLCVAAGMTLGLVGDLFMARLIPARNHVLGGIGAFGLGHILYITGMVWYSGAAGLDAPGPRWGALAAWLLVGGLGWYLMVFRDQQAGPLHYAALPYALLLAGTAGVATGLALQQTAFIGMALGAALFLLSDLILAGQLFSGLRFRLIEDIVWLTYGPGQMLLVYGAGSVLALA
jgi:hypothetical protein